MTINLTIQVTPAEAAASGVDNHGDFAIAVQPSTLSDPARRVLATMLARKQPVTTYNNGLSITIPVPAAPNPSNVAEWLESCAAAIAARNAAQAASAAAELAHQCNAVREWAARPDDEIIDSRRVGNHPAEFVVATPYHVPPAMVDLVRERIAAAGPRLAERNAALIASRATAAAEASRAAAEKAAAEKRRSDQIAAWLADTAPESMRKRAARGLLPESEIVDAIRAAAYAPLGDLPRFARLTDAQVRQELDAYDEADVDYFTRDAKTATDAEIELMDRIESSLPGCVCTLIDHGGYLADAADDDDPEIVRRAVRVALAVGELQFAREYSAG